VPCVALSIPTNEVDVALVAKAAGEYVAVLNSLNLEPSLYEVAAGLELGVLPHREPPGRLKLCPTWAIAMQRAKRFLVVRSLRLFRSPSSPVLLAAPTGGLGGSEPSPPGDRERVRCVLRERGALLRGDAVGDVLSELMVMRLKVLSPTTPRRRT
jgi:hypothetical protein